MPADTASRECIEEAGVEGTLLEEAGVVTYEFMNKWYRVRYYFFVYRRHASSPGEPGREPVWFSLEEARKLLSLENLRHLIADTSVARLSF